jgi:hypothetical protein
MPENNDSDKPENTDKPVDRDIPDTDENNEKSFFSTMKDDFKKGDFPKINVFNFLPPFPAVDAAIALAELNNIFKHNIGKVNKYVDVYTDVEIAKKKNELENLKGGAFTLEDCSF